MEHHMTKVNPGAVLGPIRNALDGHELANVSDEVLLNRYVCECDDRAFTAIVRRHGPMVLSVCRRTLRHAQDAEEAFQATFLLLARKAATIRKRQSHCSSQTPAEPVFRSWTRPDARNDRANAGLKQ